jgi:hypothetical protein
MKEKIVRLTEVQNAFGRNNYPIDKNYYNRIGEQFVMHNGKCVFKNDDERVLVLFDHAYTSVMTMCCKFENGRINTSYFWSLADRMGREYEKGE